MAYSVVTTTSVPAIDGYYCMCYSCHLKSETCISYTNHLPTTISSIHNTSHDNYTLHLINTHIQLFWMGWWQGGGGMATEVRCMHLLQGATCVITSFRPVSKIKLCLHNKKHKRLHNIPAYASNIN